MFHVKHRTPSAAARREGRPLLSPEGDERRRPFCPFLRCPSPPRSSFLAREARREAGVRLPTFSRIAASLLPVTWSALESWSRIASTPNTGLTGSISDLEMPRGSRWPWVLRLRTRPDAPAEIGAAAAPWAGSGRSRRRGPSDGCVRAMAPCSAFPEWRARRRGLARAPRRRKSPMGVVPRETSPAGHSTHSSSGGLGVGVCLRRRRTRATRGATEALLASPSHRERVTD